jgi:arylsulfatase A-like enzyme
MLITSLWFALACGVAGETFEVQRVVSGGMSPTEWRLRAALAVGYAVLALLFFLAARLVSRRERALWVATALFSVFVVVPWLNFDYLPKWNSVRTVGLSSAAVAGLFAVAPVIVRLRRFAVPAIALAALWVNGTAWKTGAAVHPPQAIGAADTGASAIVILIDTLRADHLGTYGYARPTSPNIDRLAQGSTVFDRAVAQAAWTKPSVTSLLTGSFVHRHGVVESRDALGPELPTLAEQMRAHGFHTAAFTSNPWITPEFHFDRGFDDFESGRAMGVQLTNLYRMLMRGDRVLRRVGVRVGLTDWAFSSSAERNLGNSERDERLTDAFLEWLDGHRGERFFAYLHLIGPHDPYDPPARFVEPFRDPAHADAPRPTKPPARVQSIFESAAPLGSTDLDALRAQYDGAIAFSDMLVGRVVERLQKLGLLDRILLVLVSDHGEEFYEHRNWRHGNQLYDEVVHVPMIVRFPGRVSPERSADPAMLVDVFPTVLGLLGLPNDLPTLDGRNVFGSARESARPVYSEHWRFEGGEYVSRAVSRAGMKLTETEDKTLGKEGAELYDLHADPSEQTNLLPAAAAQQDVAGELKGLLTRFEPEKPFAVAPAVEVDRSTQERLRALGYGDQAR